MSAGDPVFKADAVDALQVRAVFTDEYGTCRYGAAAYQEVEIFYDKPLGPESCLFLGI